MLETVSEHGADIQIESLLDSADIIQELEDSNLTGLRLIIATARVNFIGYYVYQADNGQIVFIF